MVLDRKTLPLILASTCTLWMACGGSEPRKARRTSAPSGVQVTRAQYGDAWPFTVEQGHVDCVPYQKAVFRTRGRTYALNGLARSKYPEIDPIWRAHPELPGLKVNIGPMIDLALEQCR